MEHARSVDRLVYTANQIVRWSEPEEISRRQDNRHDRAVGKMKMRTTDYAVFEGET
jgi:hypothetical protein